MDKNFNDENWKDVNLPHTWNSIDGANGFDFYKGACWYRKEFNIDNLAQGKKVFIILYGGIYRDVNIVIANNVHFDLMDYGSKGIYMFQEEVSNEKASLTLYLLCQNQN